MLVPVVPKGKGGSAWEKWIKEEWSNEVKLAANLRVARGLAVFLGAVFAFRNYGEALFGV